MTRVDGGIVLDPHLAGECVITLDDQEAVALRCATTSTGWRCCGCAAAT